MFAAVRYRKLVRQAAAADGLDPKELVAIGSAVAAGMVELGQTGPEEVDMKEQGARRTVPGVHEHRFHIVLVNMGSVRHFQTGQVVGLELEGIVVDRIVEVAASAVVHIGPELVVTGSPVDFVRMYLGLAQALYI